MRILAVLAGRDMSASHLRGWLSEADRVYAADGAADLCVASGRIPDVVVGDLDSISESGRTLSTDLRHRPDQDWTDADKVLAEIVADGWTEAVVCGIEGDLPDHELAILGSCIRALDKGLITTLRYRRGRAWIAGRRHPFRMEVEPERRVSVMPLVPGARLEIRGVAWPLKLDRFGIVGVGSISNRALGGPVTVTMRAGAVWVFVADI